MKSQRFLSGLQQRLLMKLKEATSGYQLEVSEFLYVGTSENRVLAIDCPHYFSALHHIREILAELETQLDNSASEVLVPELGEGEFWGLGTFQIRDKPRRIHNGFVEPVLNVPIRLPISNVLFAFLIGIKDDKEFLKREHHDHFGWHYHYLNKKKERSNIILCFDRYWMPAGGSSRPIFSEKHGEGRYHFAGRPDLWGTAKCQSVHESCAPDLDRWPIDSFKHASKEAVAVWPTTALLTPSPATKSP